MEVIFELGLNVSAKAGKRARAVMEVDYLFVIKSLINGFLVYCTPCPRDAQQICNAVCDKDEDLVSTAEEVINEAYNILYGEENDQE